VNLVDFPHDQEYGESVVPGWAGAAPTNIGALRPVRDDRGRTVFMWAASLITRR
jgi:hypothetical protein